ncbi:MAG: polysulfide reductase NrfD [Acetobacteraceae bacterium]|nr:polysulfide reductase NrfD [Acetobacteraceae bacterium]
MSDAYRGETYYGRSQLKPSPFGFMVSLYIYLAGLSGSAQMLATIGDLFGGRAARGMVRRGRWLAMLGTVCGPALLIADLHTPQRFYNMLRILRTSSPMSIGSYILTTFGLTSTVTAAAQFLADRCGWRRLLGVARAASVPASVAGAGLSVYTAALQSSTSTPHWAVSPRSLAMRYGASSLATAAAALSLGEHRFGDPRTARRLDALAFGALLVEWIASARARGDLRRTGVAAALSGSAPERLERAAAGWGTLLPAGLFGASLLLGDRGRRASRSASLLTLASGLALRHAIMLAGNESARRPAASFAMAQPRNLPHMES